MERSMWVLIAATMISQNLFIIPVMCNANVEDQKNFYYYHSPDPSTGTPPTVYTGSPPTDHTGSPPTGSSGTPPSPSGSYGGSPPYGGGSQGGSPPSHGSGSHGGSPPSHGGGSHGGSPPSNCGGTPPTGGHHHHSPSTPTHVPPSGHTYNPPISGGSTPSRPITVTPPSTPIVIPGIHVPSPPFSFDPNSPPFSCNYWRSHPTLIWGLVGYFGTMGGAFGLSSIPNIPHTPGLGSSTSIQQALNNVRTDGYGNLYREGTAAFLNSVIDHKFPFTSTQVRDKFVSATRSNKAAGAQACLFRLANEGHLKV